MDCTQVHHNSEAIEKWMTKIIPDDDYSANKLQSIIWQ